MEVWSSLARFFQGPVASSCLVEGLVAMNDVMECAMEAGSAGVLEYASPPMLR